MKRLEEPGVVQDLESNGITLYPNKGDIDTWIVRLKGPPETPYEGGTFYVKVTACSCYPFAPVQVQFLTSLSINYT